MYLGSDMRLLLVISYLIINLDSIAQFNNMGADLISEKNIEMIKASYVEGEKQVPYQIFYKFDTLGRVVESNTSDDILTRYQYIDTFNLCIQTKINRDVGNKIITYRQGWQNKLVKIYSANGDSTIHKLNYDTLKGPEGPYIQCYDIIQYQNDTAFRQVYDMNGNMLRYEVLGESGKVLAHYIYMYENDKLVYTEFYEGDRFVYKEKIDYYSDSGIRRLRISVPGEGMFSDEKNAYLTEYVINEDGLLVQEIDYLGDDLTSMTVYTYKYFNPEKNKRK